MYERNTDLLFPRRSIEKAFLLLVVEQFSFTNRHITFFPSTNLFRFLHILFRRRLLLFAFLVQAEFNLFGVAFVVESQQTIQDFDARPLADREAHTLLGLMKAVAEI